MDYNLPHKEHVIEKETETNLTQFYLYNITPPNADLQHHVHCKFMKVSKFNVAALILRGMSG